ncbi:hypothetical protein QN277_027606 [Acacia crassicarpa]|uniref:Uncharacterized protein n=1 Tax=Acacia crassicarpa TaxID=499986 RepID=A0AAE1MHB6_9FABA|nr:hypothetical protein QN277_027606 [Acacia crassicarpa]
MFADDVLLFGEATEAQASCMLNCLERPCKASGERVSTSKSSLFFSPRVPPQMKQNLSAMSGMKVTTAIGRYLGFPLTRKRRPTETFQYIVDNVSSRLAMWKEKSLSRAGRITLAKSVLSAMPLYPMQVAQIPHSICLQIERIQWKFILGHSESSAGFHPIGWHQITLPKDHGGLGFRRLSSLNDACGAKLMWKLLSGSNSLWAEVLFNKYMLRNDSDLFSVKTSDSLLWKFITKQRHLVLSGSVWNVRNGRDVKFFKDRWLLKNTALFELCTRPLSAEEEESVVASRTVGRCWDFVRLSEVLPGNVIQKLIAILPPMIEAGNDFLSWKESKDGAFSVKSAYQLLVNNGVVVGSAASRLFKGIWKWKGAERIKIFMYVDRILKSSPYQFLEE